MSQSESIKELAGALSKAQGKITGALKDSANPFFKSKYADLASCWDACRDALSANELAVVQTMNEDGYLVTTLMHSSGEWITGAVKMTPKDDSPQAVGSCITYMRRYSLAAMVGIAQIDDDANAAQPEAPKEKSAPKSSYTDPRGDAKKNADPKKVDLYTSELMKAAIRKDDLAVMQLWNECKENQDTAIVVNNNLKKNHKNEFEFIKATIGGKNE